MESALLLDVVVREGTSVLQLLPGEDESLLVRRDPLLVLDFGLHILDRVAGLHLQGDGLSGQGLDEDLHSSPQSKHQMESALLLDVVVREGASVFQLLPGEDESLLVRRDPLLVLDFGLYILDSIAGLHLQGDGLSCQGLDEDLHSSPQSKHQMESALLLDVVVREGTSVLQLLPGEDESLLVRRDPLLVLDFGLHILDRVAGLHLQGDGLSCQGLDEDLHSSPQSKHQMESALLLDVVVREGTSVLQLLPGENESLLVRRDPLLILDFGLHILDRVAGLNLQGDGLSGQGLDEYLHFESIKVWIEVCE